MKTTKRAPLSFDADKVMPSAAIIAEQTSLQENAQTNKQTNSKTRKRANEQAKVSREGRQFIAAHVMPEAARQFKMLALQKNTTTQAMLIEAINDLFAKHKLSRIA